jgi:hypothetical protein
LRDECKPAAAPSVARRRAPPPPMLRIGGGKRTVIAVGAGAFLLRAERGGGGMRSMTEAVSPHVRIQRDAFAFRDAADVAEDVFVRIQPQALLVDETAVHVLWC